MSHAALVDTEKSDLTGTFLDTATKTNNKQKT
jgi:hypothetical protein